jgi:hypothetical protein
MDRIELRNYQERYIGVLPFYRFNLLSLIKNIKIWMNLKM